MSFASLVSAYLPSRRLPLFRGSHRVTLLDWGFLSSFRVSHLQRLDAPGTSDRLTEARLEDVWWGLPMHVADLCTTVQPLHCSH